MSCPKCGRDHKRSKNGPCPNCYRKTYKNTESGKDAIRRADKASVRRHPERRMRRVVRYREKTGYYIPAELHALRNATKKLERALEAAENNHAVRPTSERRLQQSLERRDRYGSGEDLFSDGASSDPGGEH